MEHRKINKNEHRGKKGIGAIIFSRTFVFFAMLVVQLAIYSVVVYYASNTRITFIIIFVLAFLLIVHIVNDGSDPNMKIIWIIMLILTPTLGVLMYLYVRFQPLSIILKKRLKKIDNRSEKYLQKDEKMFNELQVLNKNVASLATYVESYTGCPIYKNTNVTYFPSGEQMYRSIIEQLEEAKDFIFMEYFIIERGKVWNSILRILEKKVQQGVEVRVMYDGLCTFTKLDIGYYKKLVAKGIKAKPFAPARPFLTSNQNNRDHRKILSIDGKVAFTGGINLADEYMNVYDKFGYWKDTAIMLEGDAAKSLTLQFLQMWNVSTKNIESFNRYLNVPVAKLPNNPGYALAYCDDPFSDERIGESVYHYIINSATRYVYIVSPYLVLDNLTINALTFAAKRGVDVKLIMPGRPDKKYAYCLARTYYAELMEAGVEIYEYLPGFTHAKMFVSDDEKATVGTVNLDYRSLYLHFENGCFIYRDPVVANIKEDFVDMINQSKKVTLLECKNRPLYYKLSGRLLRLLAPLM